MHEVLILMKERNKVNYNKKNILMFCVLYRHIYFVMWTVLVEVSDVYCNKCLLK